MAPVAAEERSEAAIEMMRHCDEAVAKPAAAVRPTHRATRPCDDCVVDRSLASLLSDYKPAKNRQ